MELSQKVKMALDETRMLILGAQILLGFQFRAVFDQGYEQLPASSRVCDGAALALMLTAVGLLIAPGPYHRIVEGGDDSGPLHGVVTGITELALFPFALALGVDVFVTGERILGAAGGIAAGAAATLLALAFWYASPRAARGHAGEKERQMTREHASERAKTPLATKIEQMLVEGRVILPGAQALFGFQLTIVLTQAFEKLPYSSRLVHGASLFLAALAIVLLMAPAAYHRIVYAGEESQQMHRTGSILITAATVPLAFALAGDVYVVIARIAQSAAAGLAAGATALVFLLGLWHAWPLAAAARRRRNGDRGGR